MIKIYTDGSCLENPGNGGWAAIINNNGNVKKICGNEKAPSLRRSFKGERWVSNPRPPEPQSGALTSWATITMYFCQWYNDQWSILCTHPPKRDIISQGGCKYSLFFDFRKEFYHFNNKELNNM